MVLEREENENGVGSGELEEVGGYVRNVSDRTDYISKMR